MVDTSQVLPIPGVLTAWSVALSLGKFRGQAAITTLLSRRALQAGGPYRSRDGFKLMVNPRDHFEMFMLLGVYSPSVIAALERFAFPGSSVVDAGAHIGFISLHAARCVGSKGSVHSFECDPRLASRLAATIRDNEMEWIRPRSTALWHRSGQSLELVLASRLGWSTLQLDNPVPAVGTVRVTSGSLDDYVEKCILAAPLSVLKVDVEGSELEVLRGARETICQHAPAVVVEFDPVRMKDLGQSPIELLRLMDEHGYEPWEMVRDRWARTFSLRRHDRSSSADIVFLGRHRRTRNRSSKESVWRSSE